MPRAFLLAAGLGTRLRPLTYHTPKCLLPIQGRPLLAIWLDLLSKHGVREVLINTHWLHEQVEAFFRQHLPGTAQAFRFRYKADGSSGSRGLMGEWPEVRLFYEARLLGSAGTIAANKEWVSDGEPFFILYGDNLTNVNLSAMLAFHKSHGLPFTLGVFEPEDPSRCGIAEVGADGTVLGFVEKPARPKSNLAAAGIYVADARIFDFFPPAKAGSGSMDLGYHVLPRLVGNMKAYFIKEFIRDIGTMEAYEKVQIEWVETEAGK